MEADARTGRRAGELENAILGLLQIYPQGKGAGTLDDWRKWIETRIGAWPTDGETVAALKRLRDEGLVRLVKYTPRYNTWYDYKTDVRIDERWFFYTSSFWVIIANADRTHSPRGFQNSA